MIVLFITILLVLSALIVFPPLNFPRNIPTIPFYVSFLGGMDQLEKFEKYLRTKLEKHGAVKIYFASRWNILVTKPEYLVHIFKNEDVFAKSGNHIKIPGSVLATYTGDNIISAHGQLWRLYRDVMAQSIQFPNLDPIAENTNNLMKDLENALKFDSSVAITDFLQQYSLANVGDCIVGSNLRPMHQKIKYIKLQIFKPFYMNFPSVEMLPIPSRIRAKQEVENFRQWFGDKLMDADHGAAAKLATAYNEGKLTQKQYLDNCIILMVAGHENPLLLMLSLLYVLAKNPYMQDKIRCNKEIEEHGKEEGGRVVEEEGEEGEEEDDEEEEKSPELYLSAVIYETLRMYPPLNQIINRCTTKDTMLGNIRIPKGTYVGYYNMGTGRDKTVWESPDTFWPERWGNTIEEVHANYTRAKRLGHLPAFHGRKRACLGEKFALYQCKAMVQAILGKYKISLDEDWEERITPAGPVCPMNMKLRFSKI